MLRADGNPEIGAKFTAEEFGRQRLAKASVAAG